MELFFHWTSIAQFNVRIQNVTGPTYTSQGAQISLVWVKKKKMTADFQKVCCSGKKGDTF